jgi:hypothetical protein
VARRNPSGIVKRASPSKQTFIFEKFKKNRKKYMKVVTNGELWCILILNLGAVYSEYVPEFAFEYQHLPEEESAC